MAEFTRKPSRRLPPLSSRRLPPPTSECHSCRRNEDDGLAHYFAALSLFLSRNRRFTAPNHTNPLMSAASSQRLKNAAASDRLPRGYPPCFNDGGPSGQHRRPPKVSAARSEPVRQVYIRKPQNGTARNNTEQRSAAAGSLQKQRTRVQSRFQGTGYELLRRSSAGTGSGTGVFHPLVENKETKAQDAAKANLLVSGKHRRRERLQVAAAQAVEAKRSVERVEEEDEEGSGGEEDCYYHLPPEIEFII